MIARKNSHRSAKKYPVGIQESVEVAVIEINLNSVCKKVARAQKWSAEKTGVVEKKYRAMMINFALALEGCAVVSCVDNDVGLFWQAHCKEGRKYATDMLTIAETVGAFRGKSLDEKFPKLSD